MTIAFVCDDEYYNYSVGSLDRGQSLCSILSAVLFVHSFSVFCTHLCIFFFWLCFNRYVVHALLRAISTMCVFVHTSKNENTDFVASVLELVCVFAYFFYGHFDLLCALSHERFVFWPRWLFGVHMQVLWMCHIQFHIDKKRKKIRTHEMNPTISRVHTRQKSWMVTRK